MKLASKIVILIGFIVFVSSCQKEKLPTPGGNIHSSYQESSANQRSSSDTSNSSVPVITDQGTTGLGDIVGGGDDDRDGGGGKEKVKK